jgi:hypothetical protein
LLPQREIGLVHKISSHLIGELLRMSGFNQGAVGAVGEQLLREGSPQNITGRHLGKEGMVIPVKLFGTNSLKEAAV